MAVHPLVHGRGQRRVAPDHRRWPPPDSGSPQASDGIVLAPPGHRVSRRNLSVYDRIGEVLVHGKLHEPAPGHAPGTHPRTPRGDEDERTGY